jgi:hypothetical protein
MGHGAQATRKGLIEQVKTCIDAANEATDLAGKVREANNLLAGQTGTDVAALTRRHNALAGWCGKLETRAEESEPEILMAFRNTAERLQRLEDEFKRLAQLTLWQRVRLVFVGFDWRYGAVGGCVPEKMAERHRFFVGMAPAAPTLAELKERAARRRQENEFASAVAGRASAGMAPRPLP